MKQLYKNSLGGAFGPTSFSTIIFSLQHSFRNDNFKENTRKPQKFPHCQLCKLVGGDSQYFKDNSDMLPMSVTQPLTSGK